MKLKQQRSSFFIESGLQLAAVTVLVQRFITFDFKTGILSKQFFSFYETRNKSCTQEKNNLCVKDTANPLSHHVMVSPNRFSFIQALAPIYENIK